MPGLVQHLWSNRDRFPIGSRDWVRAWGKRLFQLPQIAKQSRFQSRFIRSGVVLGKCVFLSDISEINGNFSRLSIGDESFVGQVHIAIHDRVSIGSRVCINDGVKLLAGSHALDSVEWDLVTAPIWIDDYAWIATGATLLPGVRIGKGAVVGAGAVVSKDVPPFALAVGNPAIIRENARSSILDYSPVGRLALFTAWKRIPNASRPAGCAE